MRGVDLEEALREQGVATARLGHESVPQVHGMGRLGKEWPAYLMLEWVEASTLEDRLREAEPLSVRALVQVTIDIADALEHGHARGVVHGDVQPANVLVPRDSSRRGVLVDWGGHGGHGSIVQGLVGFLSPERVRRAGHAVEPKDDVWALALTLAKATSAASLEGNLWTESGTQSSWPQRSSTEPSEASPSALNAVLARALTPDPRERLSDPGGAGCCASRVSAQGARI
jgi:serine/threonine protein kinase